MKKCVCGPADTHADTQPLTYAHIMRTWKNGSMSSAYTQTHSVAVFHSLYFRLCFTRIDTHLVTRSLYSSFASCHCGKTYAAHSLLSIFVLQRKTANSSCVWKRAANHSLTSSLCRSSMQTDKWMLLFAKSSPQSFGISSILDLVTHGLMGVEYGDRNTGWLICSVNTSVASIGKITRF